MWFLPLFGAFFFVLVMRYLWKRRLRKPPKAPFELSPEDPLLLDAIQKARQSLPRMEELFAQRPRDTYVKVTIDDKQGDPVHLWGQLLQLEEGMMRFKPMNQPLGETDLLPETLERPLADLEDWQVELADGKIHGGYTITVMFKKAKEQCENLPSEFEDQEDRYLDAG